jgi:hypothetical protein
MAARKEGYCRRFKTVMNEKRVAQRDEEYIRGKRKTNNLPNPWGWEEKWRKDNHKSWKDRTKRRHQWRENRKKITLKFEGDYCFYTGYDVIDSLRSKGYYVETEHIMWKKFFITYWK